MSTGRNLFSELNIQFLADTQLKERCISSAREKIRTNIMNRIFDDFPCLVSKEELKELTESFDFLINTDFRHSDEEISQITHGWMVKLINQAQQNLLTIKDTSVSKEVKRDNGFLSLFSNTKTITKIHSDCHIQKDLLTLLEWEDLEGAIKKDQLIAAYVQALLQSIIAHAFSSGLIAQHQKNYDKVINHINQSFRESIELPSYAKLTSKDVVVGVAAGGTISALIWYGYSFMSSLIQGRAGTAETKTDAPTVSSIPTSPSPTSEEAAKPNLSPTRISAAP